MQPTYLRITDGAQVPASEALDERGVLRSGHTMRTSHLLMDGAPEALTDEQRYAQRDHHLTNAWREPSAQFRDDGASRDAALAKIDDPYERRDQRLADAWRNPESGEVRSRQSAESLAKHIADVHEWRDQRLQNAWR
jgi:hypothetical protein